MSDYTTIHANGSGTFTFSTGIPGAELEDKLKTLESRKWRGPLPFPIGWDRREIIKYCGDWRDLSRDLQTALKASLEKSERTCLWTPQPNGGVTFACGGSLYADVEEWRPPFCSECGGKVRGQGE